MFSDQVTTKKAALIERYSQLGEKVGPAASISVGEQSSFNSFNI